MCIDIDDGKAEPGIVEATGPLVACERGLRTVGRSVCSWDAGCICGTVPVGVTGKAGVEEEMKDGAGSIGVLFPVSTTGTGDIPGNDCWGRGLRCVGLFIASKESLIPL